MNVRERMAEVEKARAYWKGLDDDQRGAIGDALVLGDFDWREWGFVSKPSRAFMDELDQVRMHWEMEHAG